ncbi:hypothetical protein LWC34_29230 [Kibdelosporangium philippinense]|uniref:Penicillin-binding protein transpeptidase domain-containing protein n=1 Tax=Kibdelosporangium philippinense TaxID=211113 RepID=A0ABS8ZHP1_9PSEU|nr:penicillin-binding transpeptidase domain-containing protein [Kibdelosporangium philippinense]MCE7006879.1 hypothetical protein [Kibdelosporangium philippinense]
MNKRSFTKGITALVVVVGVIAAVVIFWGRDAETETVTLPRPVNPPTFHFADGTALDPAKPRDDVLIKKAMAELNEAGISEDELYKNGYTIELTVDPKAQQLAEAAVAEARAGQPGTLRSALVAVEPKTGRIVAYMGYQGEKQGIDYARSWQNPGTAFTPFALVAFLHKGKRLDATYNGHTERKFGGVTINNAQGSNCGEQCTVAEAMRISNNTVFADIAFNETGLKAVATAAIEAGIPANIGPQNIPLETNPDINIVLGGGKYVARPVDMAGAYATFAANGAKRAPHIVATVKVSSDGDKLVWSGDESTVAKPAFSRSDVSENAKIARTVTESLLPAGLPCAENRPCASKPGDHGCSLTQKTTNEDSCAAWMTGYTPQISTAVWFGSDDNSALKDKTGAAVTGKGLPGQVWQRFMNDYLKGKPVEQFPPL